MSIEKHIVIQKFEALKENVENACKKIDLPSQISHLHALEKEMTLPDFWNNQEEAQKVVAELQRVRALAEPWQQLQESVQDLESMVPSLENDDLETFFEELEEIHKVYEQSSFILYFSGEHDKEPALLTINSGTGGDDAEDFAGMLFRMYMMFFESKGLAADVHEYTEGAGSDGIKRVSIEVNGSFAYGTLKWEKGVHRLVRLSPFKSSDSRQTSFASVEVMPLLKSIGKDDIDIKEEDLRVDTFRSSGAGGQKVNKTDSAVRLTHIPTGIAVSCQVERSQHQNKERAMEILRAKLFQKQREEEEKLRKDLKGDSGGVDWGKQIRSYVLHPYKMIKDHRTGYETSQVEKFLSGDMEECIEIEIRTLGQAHI